MNIFFPVLNWGLGHASRSLPIIKTFLAHGHDVICASDGEALEMLRRELPDQLVLELPGYGISYGSKYMPLNMLRHGPGMLKTIRTEHELTKAIVEHHHIDCIITDNRYGCYHASVPSAIITHQLQVFTGNKIMDVYIRRQIRGWLKKFNEVWIPDNPPKGNITGDLSGIDINPVPKYFLGVISELSAMPHAGEYDAVAVISGPEPQRTYFESQLHQQLTDLPGRYAIVRGKPDDKSPVRQEGNLTIFPFCSRAELSSLLSETNVVISRSGYTTLMDLAKTGHKAILCPTPGQYEQIYLADRLAGLNQCVYVRQDDLDLKNALERIPEIQSIGAGTDVIQNNFPARLAQLSGIAEVITPSFEEVET